MTFHYSAEGVVNPKYEGKCLSFSSPFTLFTHPLKMGKVSQMQSSQRNSENKENYGVSKVKRTGLSLEDRLKVVDFLNNGESERSIANRLDFQNSDQFYSS